MPACMIGLATAGLCSQIIRLFSFKCTENNPVKTKTLYCWCMRTFGTGKHPEVSSFQWLFVHFSIQLVVIETYSQSCVRITEGFKFKPCVHLLGTLVSP